MKLTEQVARAIKREGESTAMLALMVQLKVIYDQSPYGAAAVLTNVIASDEIRDALKGN